MNLDSNIIPPALLQPDPQIIVRPAALNDLDALRRSCWADHPLLRCRTTLIRAVYAAEQGHGMGMVALQAGEAVGYGQWFRQVDCAEISDVLIAAAARGKGLGTALIQHLTRSASAVRDRIQLAVFDDNPRALRLYLSLGFTHFATIRLESQQIIYLRLNIPGKQKAPDFSSADR